MAVKICRMHILHIVSLILTMAFPFSALAKTVEAGDATTRWIGKGIIDDHGDGERIFMGQITGTLFVRHPSDKQPNKQRAEIHAALVHCQTVARLNPQKDEEQRALCSMTAHEGRDIAYSAMRCQGPKDACRGGYTFIWGSGGFAGIKGSTLFIGGVNIERPSEDEISGYAFFPALTYTLP